MADEDKDSKTEKPTPKRLNMLRREGSIPQSSDVASLATLTAGAIGMLLTFQRMGTNLASFFERSLTFGDVANPGAALRAMLTTFALSVAPLMLIAAIAGIATGLWQTKLLFTLKPLQPNFNKLKPNFKKVLPGKSQAVELLKSMAKMTALAVVVVYLLGDLLPMFARLTSVPVTEGAIEVGWGALQLAYWVLAALLVIAILDVYWVNYKFIEDNKMTKQQVKDERRNADGDPAVKIKMRQKQREASQRRAVSSVQDATVLITNPTHIAIALRYDLDSDDAPMVIGKGEDATALKMRERAREFSVPIVENRPLARAIHATVEEGHPIPLEMYQAVAEVIAHVMQLNGEVPAA